MRRAARRDGGAGQRRGFAQVKQAQRAAGAGEPGAQQRRDLAGPARDQDAVHDTSDGVHICGLQTSLGTPIDRLDAVHFTS